MVQVEKIESTLEINVGKATDDIQRFARDTGKELDQVELIELEINVGKLQAELADARNDLRTFKKQGDEDLTLEAQLRVNRLSSSLTEAKRQLNNYRNTGDKTLSRLQAKFDSVNDTINAQGTALRQAFSGDVIGAIGTLKASFAGASVAAKGFLLALGPITIVLGAISLAFSTFGPIARSFETAFAGVKKTLDGTPQQFSQLRGEIEQLSRELPLTFEELSKIGELGGQLGVPIESVSEFTRVVAQLGISTGLSAEEISLSFARIASVTKTPLESLDELGSSLTALGNNFAAKEDEILNFTNRISGAGAVVGIAAQDLFAISTAFTAVGLTAEAGGSSVSKAFLAINNAVQQGGSDLQNFAKIAGVTSQEFSKQFQEDATGAFVSFVEGLGKAGPEASAELESVLGKSSELQRTFLSLAGNTDILTDALNTSRDAFAENTALIDEVNKRLETNDSRLGILQNKRRVVGADIGQTIVDFVVPALEFVSESIFKLQKTAIVFGGNLNILFTKLSIFAGDTITAIEPIGKAFVLVFNGASKVISSFINNAIDGINTILLAVRSLPGGDSLVTGLIDRVKAPEISFEGIKTGVEQARKELSTLEAEIEKSLKNIDNIQEKAVSDQRNTILSEINEGGSGVGSGVGGGGGGSRSSQAKKEADDIAKAEAKLQEDIVKANLKSQEILRKKNAENKENFIKTYDDIEEGVTKNIENISKEIDKTGDSIAKLDEKIANVGSEASSDLASRFLEVQDALGAEDITDEERKALEAELELLKANTTEELRAEAIRRDGLSTTEKILEDKNTELALLEQQKEAEQERLAILEQTKKQQLAISDFLRDKQIENEKLITNATLFEIKKRQDALLNVGTASNLLAENALTGQVAQQAPNITENINVRVEGVNDPVAVKKAVNEAITESARNRQRQGI